MRRVLFATFLLCSAAFAADDWGPVQFLVGKWSGEGGGQPGTGAGAFTFAPDLQGKVLVRKSFAEYPAANGRPASRHEDLMIVYRDEAAGNSLKATYFDSEGHFIHYLINAGGSGAVFTSDGKADQMRYRMTYTPAGKDSMKFKFEIAPPGRDFAAYIEAGLKRE